MPDGFKRYVHLLNKKLSPYGWQRLSSKQLSAIQSRELKTARDRNDGAALSEQARKQFERDSFVGGWRFETDIKYKDENVQLDLLVSKNFPEVLPKIYIASPSTKPLDLPHLERDGRLCVWKETDRADTNDLSYVLDLIESALTLVSKGTAGLLDDHFEDEFLSYWAYHCGPNQSIKSLCSPHTRLSRPIYGYRTSTRVYYADTRTELIDYLDNVGLLADVDGNRKRQRKTRIGQIFESVLFHFERTWHPQQFPNNGRDLMSLIEDEESCEPMVMIQALGKALGNRRMGAVPVLISFRTENGPCLCSVVFTKSLFNSRNSQSTIDGFRNTMSYKAIRNQIAGIKVYGNLIDRFDQSWCLGRDHNESLQSLKDINLVLIGCGSVGAATARLLIQSGVRNLSLFDPDILTAENISRHELGLDSVGVNKAKALSVHLRKKYPFVKIDAFGQDWQGAVADQPNAKSVVENAEIIVSCTADWASDRALINYQSEHQLAPIVFGAVEAHAMAAHAIVNTEGSCAFESLHHCCGTNVGNLINPVTDWPDRTVIQVPACAGEFQPYGAIELLAAHKLLCTAVFDLITGKGEIDATHHVHLSSTRKLEELGGQWSKQWQEKLHNSPAGNTVLNFKYVDQGWTQVDD